MKICFQRKRMSRTSLYLCANQFGSFSRMATTSFTFFGASFNEKKILFLIFLSYESFNVHNNNKIVILT